VPHAAISEMVALYEEPRWQAWAESWLSGQDRSDESAQVAFEFCVELAGGPGLKEAQRRLGIHTLQETRRESGRLRGGISCRVTEA
jgi:hypothetical protein